LQRDESAEYPRLDMHLTARRRMPPVPHAMLQGPHANDDHVNVSAATAMTEPVAEDDGVVDGDENADRETDGEPVFEGVDDGVREIGEFDRDEVEDNDLLGVDDADDDVEIEALELGVPVTELDAVVEAVIDAVLVVDGVDDRDTDGVQDTVADVVADEEAEVDAVTDAVADVDTESDIDEDPVIDGVSVREGLAEADEVSDTVPVALSEGDSVSEGVSEGDALSDTLDVSVRLGVAVPETLTLVVGVTVTVGVGDSTALSDGDSLSATLGVVDGDDPTDRVTDRLRVTLRVRVREYDAPTERDGLGVSHAWVLHGTSSYCGICWQSSTFMNDGASASRVTSLKRAATPPPHSAEQPEKSLHGCVVQ
jgi:hypothetical protein